MTAICAILNESGIACYGYTARKDLDFKELMKVATVQGSSFMVTNNFKFIPKGETIEGCDKVCAGDCRICSLCWTGKGLVIAIITEGDEVIPGLANDVFFVPPADEIIAPMLSCVPLQLLSYYMGIARGVDVDARDDEKRTALQMAAACASASCRSCPRRRPTTTCCRTAW